MVISDMGIKSHFHFQFSKMHLDSGELEKICHNLLVCLREAANENYKQAAMHALLVSTV